MTRTTVQLQVHDMCTCTIKALILLPKKFLSFDWLRAEVFQLNLKYLHVKLTVTMVTQNHQIIGKNGGKISRSTSTWLNVWTSWAENKNFKTNLLAYEAKQLDENKRMGLDDSISQVVVLTSNSMNCT